ncbi:MAG: hypothetical protein JW941_08375 [Candidatus Coatesbacteria bacterium]|nr:hypothetical protein [Candidatus Coatesbacteria bacterium]
MEINRIIALLLAASGGEIHGRTMIQKQMYFLSRALGENFNYRAYYYGPYSDEVREGQDDLIGLGFVRMRREGLGIARKDGHEVARYDFKLTESGDRLVQWLRKEHPGEDDKIREFVENLNAVPGGADYMSLSLAAKVHYILRRSNQAHTRGEIRESAKELGWGEIGERDIDGAVGILDTLGFIED